MRAATKVHLEFEREKTERKPKARDDVSLPFGVELAFERILVKRDQAPTETESGLAIPLAHREIPMRGTICAVAPNSRYKVGDRVLISKYVGNEFKFDGRDPDQYVIMRDGDVLMRLEGEPSAV